MPLKGFDILLLDAASSLQSHRHGSTATLFLHIVLASTTYFFDALVYKLGTDVLRQARQGVVVVESHGEDEEADPVLEIFLSAFNRPTSEQTTAASSCIPHCSAPSIIYIVFLLLIYLIAILLIVFEGKMRRLRNDLTGAFYSDREDARVHNLRRLIAENRERASDSLARIARVNWRRKNLSNHLVSSRLFASKWKGMGKCWLRIQGGGFLLLFTQEAASIIQYWGETVFLGKFYATKK